MQIESEQEQDEIKTIHGPISGTRSLIPLLEPTPVRSLIRPRRIDELVTNARFVGHTE